MKLGIKNPCAESSLPANPAIQLKSSDDFTSELLDTGCTSVSVPATLALERDINGR